MAEQILVHRPGYVTDVDNVSPHLFAAGDDEVSTFHDPTGLGIWDNYYGTIYTQESSQPSWMGTDWANLPSPWVLTKSYAAVIYKSAYDFDWYAQEGDGITFHGETAPNKSGFTGQVFSDERTDIPGRLDLFITPIGAPEGYRVKVLDWFLWTEWATPEAPAATGRVQEVRRRFT